MAYVALVILVVFLFLYLGSIVRHRGRGIVARRGMSIGADLRALGDQPRVRVRAVTQAGPDQVRLVLTPDPGAGDDAASADLDVLVNLGQEDFGYKLLREWKRSESVIAIVVPPDSRLLRLRSIHDLQPLTLRIAGEG